MVVDGLSVTETINDVQNIVDKEPWTDPVKNKIKDLILIASIMKDRLSTNSQNSSQPPSQDEQKDKDPKGKPKPPGSSKPGGQKGHTGNQLKPVENPDEIIDLPVDRSQLPEGKEKGSL